MQREGDDYHAIVSTNVPHLGVHHSPSGFEFGYGGSGPADLALNVCQFYLNSIGYQGEKTNCCFAIQIGHFNTLTVSGVDHEQPHHHFH